MFFIYLLFSVLGQSSTDGSLKPCPDKPNCVSTLADSNDTEHFMPPLSYTVSEEDLISVIETILLAMPRATLESKTTTSMHVTYRSRVFKFVDDVHIQLNATEKQLHFRSAARTGHSDLGVNRKRMTDFLNQLKASLPNAFE